jgi:hypothetical protein
MVIITTIHVKKKEAVSKGQPVLIHMGGKVT